MLRRFEAAIGNYSKFGKTIIFRDAPLFVCKVGKNSFVIDYNGNMCPCMKMRHKGLKLTNNNFDKIWESFGKYVTMKASANFKCRNCQAFNYCEVCSAEMDFLYGSYEYRTDEQCAYAFARKAFYKDNLSANEVLFRFNSNNL